MKKVSKLLVLVAILAIGLLSSAVAESVWPPDISKWFKQYCETNPTGTVCLKAAE